MTDEKQNKKWHQKWWGVIFLLLCALALVYLAVLIYKVVFIVDSANNVSANLNSALSSAVDIRTVAEKTDAPFLGDSNAKIVIVEFGDFQCPYCQAEAPIIRKIAAANKDIKIIFRNFPNPAVHSQALAAALAAQCARAQNKFWEFHDLLFANQNDFSDDNFKKWAQQLSLNMDQFDSCLSSSAYFSVIKTDMQDGLTLNLSATPTFFINGTKATGAISFADFETLIGKIRQSQK